jgi:hypothetical protein
MLEACIVRGHFGSSQEISHIEIRRSWCAGG